MEIWLVYDRKFNSLADGVAYGCKEAALLSMEHQGMKDANYKLVSFNLASLEMVQRWIDQG